MSDRRELARRLCASLFDDAEIEHVRAHRIMGRFSVESHSHPDLIQFDWMVDCRGSIMLGQQMHKIEGTSFLLAGPGVNHGMTLDASDLDSRVYHLRVQVNSSLKKLFHGVAWVDSNLPHAPSIESALSDVWRLSVGSANRTLLVKAKLAEAIVLWPGTGDVLADGAKSRSSAGLDRDLDAALQLMEKNLMSPPTLDQLASAAHLSVRHFTRRFRSAFGLSPVEYLDRKRLALAQQLLAYEASTVSEVADRMRFSSLATFSRWFSNLSGESPNQYRSRPHML